MSDTLIIGLVVAGGTIYYYNKIVRVKEDAANAEAQISVQLDRRGKVFDSLISTIEKATSYENDTLKQIVALRNRSSRISDVNDQDKINLEMQISEIVSSGQLSNALNLTVEAYPELKATSNIMQLQEEIVSTENKLAYSKQAYNDAVEKYNIMKSSMPEMFIIKLFTGLNKDFNYWKLDAEVIRREEERRIKF